MINGWRIYLCNLVPYVNIQDTYLQVKDVFHDGFWHWEHITTLLPMEVRMSVQSYFLDNNCDDVVIWGTTFAGVYQAKHAYRWLIHTPSSLLARFEN